MNSSSLWNTTAHSRSTEIMNQLNTKIEEGSKKALLELYGMEVDSVELTSTRKEFEGDLTLVVFPYLKASRKKPEDTAEEIGNYLQEEVGEISGFNVVKGFLNLVIADDFWIKKLQEVAADHNFGEAPTGKESMLVEYSSPNTNKPLHLGHIRNNLLGHSVAELLKAAGKKVVRAQIINDRGIHICKSMVAWQKFGQGETPESSGLKGDKLAGKYYVEFDKTHKAQVEKLMAEGKPEEEAKQEAPIMREARESLKKWEENDPDTMELWKTMNEWVYEGFEETYLKLGVSFDKNYFESQTYLLGKEVVKEGLEKGVFYKEKDGSVWVDLSDEGLDKKLLLRADGTSVYITQDIGTAIQRFIDFGISGMIYTVGNEQDYHFKVLFLILKKLGHDWAGQLYHLSYGMVNLPSGKMKSREGTVVDADDLIAEMVATAKEISEKLGKTGGMSDENKKALYHMIGMGALKYYILRVDPKKRMMFDPEESIDFQGNTGPFIQYTHARIKSLLRKAELADNNGPYTSLEETERAVVKLLVQYPNTVLTAAENHSPALVAAYLYDLVKTYNALYQQLPILTDPDRAAVVFRLKLSEAVATVVKKGMALLGIEVPEKM